MALQIGDVAVRHVDTLVPRLYSALHSRAQRLVRREWWHDALDATELVHETYLRLLDQRHLPPEDHGRFLAIAGIMMRRILWEHARNRLAAKRAGGWQRVSLDDDFAVVENRDEGLIELERALDELAAMDSAKAEIVRLRYFTGLTLDETAEVLKTSPATVFRRWRSARTWLRNRLTPRERPVKRSRSKKS